MFSERDSIRKNSIVLGAFALITGTLLATTQLATKDKIAAAVRHAEQKALLEIIPMGNQNNDLLMDVQPIPEQFWPLLGLDHGGNIHISRDANGMPQTLILPTVAADGYSGDIHIIVGIHRDGSIAGVRITEHSETPGLGDKVDIRKNDWVLSFNGKSLDNPQTERWKVKKDGGEFDQFTGATITPRAVINQVAKALQYFANDQQRLIKATQQKRAAPLESSNGQ